MVFAPSPASFASASHGGMLLKYGLEAPSLEFALLPDRSPRGRVWASNDDGSTSNVGVAARGGRLSHIIRVLSRTPTTPSATAPNCW